jgi:hypothetical protein
VIGIRLFELQQLRHGSGSGMKQSGTHRRLDPFQIETTGRFAITANDVKQLLYFAGDFLLDDLSCFFSWAVGAVSANGRSAQISVLTSTNC